MRFLRRSNEIILYYREKVHDINEEYDSEKQNYLYNIKV